MNSTPLHSITDLLDSTLRIREIRDASVALNGLQVENNGSITKVALAVDGSQKTIDDAIAAGADLLILHHGIYWCGLRPMTGWFKKKIESCLQHNLAVYGAHLPLDMHPELGNNASIAKALGLQDITPEVDYHGTLIGMAGTFNGTVAELRSKFAEITGATVTGIVHDGDAPAGRVAICSGGAGEDPRRSPEAFRGKTDTGEVSLYRLGGEQNGCRGSVSAGRQLYQGCRCDPVRALEADSFHRAGKCPGKSHRLPGRCRLSGLG